MRDLGLHLAGQAGHDLRGELGPQVRHHQRDGLRVLVAEQPDHLPGVGVVQELERLTLQGGREPLDHVLRAVTAHGRLEQLLGEAQPAAARTPLGPKDAA